MAWQEPGGSYFDNLSASAEFAAAPPATCTEQVRDVVRVFSLMRASSAAMN